MPPPPVTLKLVPRGFVVKILQLRGVALVLSKITTPVLSCSVLSSPTGPCAEAELGKWGQPGQAEWAESSVSFSRTPAHTPV